LHSSNKVKKKGKAMILQEQTKKPLHPTSYKAATTTAATMSTKQM
jgi:hypothetical protein